MDKRLRQAIRTGLTAAIAICAAAPFSDCHLDEPRDWIPVGAVMILTTIETWLRDRPGNGNGPGNGITSKVNTAQNLDREKIPDRYA